MPVSDAPKAAPTMADSAMGVSMTRSGPKRSMKHVGDFERAAVNADVFAEAEDGGVAVHFFPDSLANGFEIVRSTRGRVQTFKDSSL